MTSEDLLELFNSRTSGRSFPQACLGCGTCTFVCPTCQCYDIRDFNTGQRDPAVPLLGQLHVLGLHEDGWRPAPRLTQLERFRQRFMHKLVYFPLNNDGHIRLRRLRALLAEVSDFHEYCQSHQGAWKEKENEYRTH